MLKDLVYYRRSPEADYDFSVLVPTWNNLPCLELCIRSLREQAQTRLQIIVIANEAKDGSLAWLEAQPDLDLLYSPQNLGICYGVNLGRSLAKAEYLVYLNDDMYVLPGWDAKLKAAIAQIGHREFMLSATMIEPMDTGNPCVRVGDFGRKPSEFRETELLQTYTQFEGADWSGSTWPPCVLHRELWDLVGGFSTEFSPGMYSDPDLAFKLYQAGVRLFWGKGDSLVYHFGSQSTKRIRHNPGRQLFLRKWGLSAQTFTRFYLQRGQVYTGPLADKIELPTVQRWLNTWKRFWNF